MRFALVVDDGHPTHLQGDSAYLPRRDGRILHAAAPAGRHVVAQNAGTTSR